MRLLYRHDFAMVWLAGLIAYTGSGMFFVALPIWVYQEYGSATLVGTATLMAVIPSVALGTIAGVFVDRWNRKRIMVNVTLLRVGFLLILAFAVQIEWFWLVLAVRLGTASAMEFFGPAEQSLLPRLVENEFELTQANNMNQLNNNLGGLIGTGLGGVLLVWVGMEGIALIMAALTTIGALLLSRIRYQDHRPGITAPQTEASQPFSLARSTRNLAAEWRDGMTLFIRNPNVRILLVLFSVLALSEAGFTTLFAVFALEALDTSEAGVSAILVGQTVGGMLGAVLLSVIPLKMPAHRLLQASILLCAAIELVFYGYPLFSAGFLVVSVILQLIEGFPIAAVNATAMTVFQTRVSDDVLGRAFGALGSFQAVAMLVATPLVGVLADLFSAQAVLIALTLTIFGAWALSLRLSDATVEAEETFGESETRAGG